MTPSVANDFVQDLAARRSTFLTTVKSTLKGLNELNVHSTELEPGTADLAFVIPRDLFKNQLAPFAKELTFISRLMDHFGEAVTGKSQPVELEGLSSSSPTVALVAVTGAIAAIGTAVNKFLEAWEKIEKIRRLHAELKEIGIKKAALEELTEEITTTIEEVVEESTQITLANFPGEPERKNELENAIRQDTSRLFGQIERGLTIQFRAEPTEDAGEAENAALDKISRISRTIQFPQIRNEPVLLTDGEILEGDIPTVKTSKKTSKKTTSTTFKTVKEKGKSDWANVNQNSIEPAKGSS